MANVKPEQEPDIEHRLRLCSGQIFQDAADEINRLRALDNPEYDCTDAAHPAWWRGNDHATASLCQLIDKAINGGNGRALTWEETMAEIKRLRADRDRADRDRDAAELARCRRLGEIITRHPSWTLVSCLDKQCKSYWHVEDDNENLIGQGAYSPLAAIEAAEAWYVANVEKASQP